VTDPFSGWARSSRGTARRPRSSPSGRPSRWLTVGIPLALAGIVAAVVAAYVVLGDGPAPRTRSDAVPAGGSELPAAELAGEWSGEGSQTRCAGFDDEDCSGERTVSLTVDCSSEPCVVTPFDRGYGSPPLRFEDGRYRAAGPLPPELAPTCGGAPTHSAQWRLELVAVQGRLAGTYEESTIQGFDCGATGVEWRVVLEHR